MAACFPCSDTKRLKRPNLFILGAPKCGTTAMAQWLAEHPDVFVSPVKEPHYFCEEYQLTPGLDEYEALFADAPVDVPWSCEASVWYLFSDSAVPNILKYAPSAKFVVMLRRPDEMIPSLFEQQRFNGNELLEDLSQALSKNNSREMGVPDGARDSYRGIQHLAYYKSCALGWQVERLLDLVHRSQIHFVFLEDIEENPNGAFKNLLDFLELAYRPPSSFTKVNSAKERKSFVVDSLVLKLARLKAVLGIKRRFRILSDLRRWNTRFRDRDRISDHVKGEIVKRLAPDTEILANLTGRDLSHWSDR